MGSKSSSKQCIQFPKLGMPVFKPSSHTPSLLAVLSADEDSHPQIRKREREEGSERMGFLAMNPLSMQLNSKATSKNAGEIISEDGFLAERGLEKSPHLTVKGEEIKDYI